MMTERTIEERLTEIEQEVRRTRVMVEAFAMTFSGSIYPLLRRGIETKQLRPFLDYQDEARRRVAAGGTVTPDEFTAKVRELFPTFADEVELPGIIVSWMFKDEELRPLYDHLRDAGLPNVEPWPEEKSVDGPST